MNVIPTWNSYEIKLQLHKNTFFFIRQESPENLTWNCWCYSFDTFMSWPSYCFRISEDICEEWWCKLAPYQRSQAIFYKMTACRINVKKLKPISWDIVNEKICVQFIWPCASSWNDIFSNTSGKTKLFRILISNYFLTSESVVKSYSFSTSETECTREINIWLYNLKYKPDSFQPHLHTKWKCDVFQHLDHKNAS